MLPLLDAPGVRRFYVRDPVCADRAPGGGTEQSMVSSDMAGKATNRRTRQTARFRPASHEQRRTQRSSRET